MRQICKADPMVSLNYLSLCLSLTLPSTNSQQVGLFLLIVQVEHKHKKTDFDYQQANTIATILILYTLNTSLVLFQNIQIPTDVKNDNSNKDGTS